MKQYRYKKIDAFTSENSMGNPAACIFLEDNERLTEEEMLYIAKQHKGFRRSSNRFWKQCFWILYAKK